MDSTILLVIAALVIYVIMSICGLIIPVCIISKKHQERSFGRGTERIISFCNCMAGGFFLGMCFMALLPFSQEKTKQVLDKFQVTTSFPLAEFTCIVGFFLIMTVEQVIQQCQDSKSSVHEPMRMEDAERSRPNYYKTVRDESSSSEQLLSRSPPDVSPSENHSVLTEVDPAQQVYQNVPMVTFKDEEEEMASPSVRPKIRPAVGAKCSHQNHVETLLQQSKSGGKKSSRFRLFIFFLAISCHQLFEGMTLGLQADHMKMFHLFVGIVFHEALISFSGGIIVTRHNLSLSESVKFILLISAASPLGIFLGILIQHTPGAAGDFSSAVLLSISTGVFVFICFQMIHDELASSSKDRLAKIGFYFLGFALLSIFTVAMGSHH